MSAITCSVVYLSHTAFKLFCFISALLAMDFQLSTNSITFFQRAIDCIVVEGVTDLQVEDGETFSLLLSSLDSTVDILTQRLPLIIEDQSDGKKDG